jgi:hypothetical protein
MEALALLEEMKMIKDLFRKSIPKSKNIHGIEIKKLPLGAYLDAIDSIKNLPEILLEKSFPGLTPDQVLSKFKSMDQDMLIQVASNLLVTVPEQALRFMSKLIGTEYEILRNDPAIGLNGIKDIIREFWKINNMQSFFSDVWKALQGSLMKQMGNGSKN